VCARVCVCVCARARTHERAHVHVCESTRSEQRSKRTAQQCAPGGVAARPEVAFEANLSAQRQGAWLWGSGNANRPVLGVALSIGKHCSCACMETLVGTNELFGLRQSVQEKHKTAVRHGKTWWLRCTTLSCCVLCCALRCVALRCVALRCVALRCVALRCVALRCVALQKGDRLVGYHAYHGWQTRVHESSTTEGAWPHREQQQQQNHDTQEQSRSLCEPQQSALRTRRHSHAHTHTRTHTHLLVHLLDAASRSFLPPRHVYLARADERHLCGRMRHVWVSWAASAGMMFCLCVQAMLSRSHSFLSCTPLAHKPHRSDTRSLTQQHLVWPVREIARAHVCT
jgi:hypothetical protein